MDEFAVTVNELREYLADKPGEARVVITPPRGRSFPLLGWAVDAEGRSVVLTGAEGAYDTTPEER